jgi:hypothetical protein
MGNAYFGARLRAQVDMMVQLSGAGKGGFHFENIPLFARAAELALRLSRLDGRGRRHAEALCCHARTMPIVQLPSALAGLRILHLSDLHLDTWPGFGARIAGALEKVAFDLCLVSGDFRFLDSGRYEHLAAELRSLAPALRCKYGTFGVLGNHDFLEMVPLIESNGIRVLLNEPACVQIGDARLWIVGLDDPHLYGMHDFERALRSVGEGEARVLLVHSPEVVDEASQHGFLAYFTGHTHGGQICLPGGAIPYVHGRCERKYAAGAWHRGPMSGYTSRGVGASGVFARFNCPPEIVVHQLAVA